MTTAGIGLGESKTIAIKVRYLRSSTAAFTGFGLVRVRRAIVNTVGGAVFIFVVKILIHRLVAIIVQSVANLGDRPD